MVNRSVAPGVVWHDTCPATWPQWAREWACSRGSLTRRLVALGGGFAVQPWQQGVARVRVGSRPVGAGHERVMRRRLVTLKVQGQAVVLAQTLMAVRGARSDWPFWNGLGNRSLGSMLFTNPAVRRGPLMFASLPASTPWVLGLCKVQGLTTQGHERWYARCARFELGRGVTPLWVMEVFLPRLGQFSQDIK